MNLLRLLSILAFVAGITSAGEGHGCPPGSPFQGLQQVEQTQRPDPAAEVEARFKAQALALEKADLGHSVGRHGPEISADALAARIKTGFAPDGSLSPARVSTQFLTWRQWLETREAALKKAVARGHQIRGPPAQGEPDRISIRVEHGVAVGRGFVGDPATREKIDAADPETGEPILDYRGRVRRIRIFREVEPLVGLSRTATTLQWNADLGRWVVAQHYPDGRDWDPVAQAYTSAIEPPTASSP